jgi:hypothetical protein
MLRSTDQPGSVSTLGKGTPFWIPRVLVCASPGVDGGSGQRWRARIACFLQRGDAGRVSRPALNRRPGSHLGERYGRKPPATAPAVYHLRSARWIHSKSPTGPDYRSSYGCVPAASRQGRPEKYEGNRVNLGGAIISTPLGDGRALRLSRREFPAQHRPRAVAIRGDLVQSAICQTISGNLGMIDGRHTLRAVRRSAGCR